MKRLIPAAALAAAACAAPAADAPQPAAAPAFTDDDGWVMVIEAERYAYLIDLAKEGAIEGPPAMTAPDPSDRARAAAATRAGARGLLELREITCAHETVAPEACAPLAPPAWLGAAPDEEPAWAEIRARIDWLTEVMWPHVEAGCDAGRSRQGPDEPDYCSVE